MKRSLRDKWVAALRSGDYNQTSGQLGYKDAYCCLGVLCMVDDEITKFKSEIETLCVSFQNGNDDADVLPKNYKNHIGMSEAFENQAVNWNDEQCLTFAQIADKIEELLPVEDD